MIFKYLHENILYCKMHSALLCEFFQSIQPAFDAQIYSSSEEADWIVPKRNLLLIKRKPLFAAGFWGYPVFMMSGYSRPSPLQLDEEQQHHHPSIKIQETLFHFCFLFWKERQLTLRFNRKKNQSKVPESL